MKIQAVLPEASNARHRTVNQSYTKNVAGFHETAGSLPRTITWHAQSRNNRPWLRKMAAHGGQAARQGSSRPAVANPADWGQRGRQKRQPRRVAWSKAHRPLAAPKELSTPVKHVSRRAQGCRSKVAAQSSVAGDCVPLLGLSESARLGKTKAVLRTVLNQSPAQFSESTTLTRRPPRSN